MENRIKEIDTEEKNIRGKGFFKRGADKHYKFLQGACL